MSLKLCNSTDISFKISLSLLWLEADDCDDKNNSNTSWSSVVSVMLLEESTLILAEKKNILLFILFSTIS